MKLAADHRRRELAQIHIAVKDLRMAEDTYRGLLWALGRVHSSKDLDYAGRSRVIEHMRKLGWKPKPAKIPQPQSAWAWVNNAAEDRKPMLRKIGMMLRAAGREKAYVDAIAQRMHGVSLVEFCAPDQLQAIVASLVADQRRRAAKVG